jgi:hypothetical protein
MQAPKIRLDRLNGYKQSSLFSHFISDERKSFITLTYVCQYYKTFLFAIGEKAE